MTDTSFDGFPTDTIRFLAELRANNNKPWFDEHKPDFEAFIMNPARAFVGALGKRLRELSHDVVADPRVNKSIFRIYRDIRFSHDKTPYKTHLALLFWVGEGAKLENPGYYFHLDAENLLLGGGIYQFTKPMLKAYREAVVDPVQGPILAKIITALKTKGYDVGYQTYKRVPRGYSPDHKYAGLLRHSGVTLGKDLGLPEALHTPALMDICFEVYRDAKPIIDWLQQVKGAI
ncbi:MAG: DUF2461 domain-containing protein [Chloroflexota bacterium]